MTCGARCAECRCVRKWEWGEGHMRAPPNGFLALLRVEKVVSFLHIN